MYSEDCIDLEQLIYILNDAVHNQLFTEKVCLATMMGCEQTRMLAIVSLLHQH